VTFDHSLASGQMHIPVLINGGQFSWKLISWEVDTPVILTTHQSN